MRIHQINMSAFLLALLPVALGLSMDWRPPQSASGHMMSGVHLRAAGVVPYTNRPGRGIHFLLQSMTNGSRTGKLCDFGGRQEDTDGDIYGAFVLLCRPPPPLPSRDLHSAPPSSPPAALKLQLRSRACVLGAMGPG